MFYIESANFMPTKRLINKFPRQYTLRGLLLFTVIVGFVMAIHKYWSSGASVECQQQSAGRWTITQDSESSCLMKIVSQVYEVLETSDEHVALQTTAVISADVCDEYILSHPVPRKCKVTISVIEDKKSHLCRLHTQSNIFNQSFDLRGDRVLGNSMATSMDWSGEDICVLRLWTRDANIVYMHSIILFVQPCYDVSQSR
jgi:hypothetical protein